jgi:hypothetical protein
MRIREIKRVVWKGMLGTVLAENRSEYFVAFNLACQYVPKDQCELAYGYLKGEVTV